MKYKKIWAGFITTGIGLVLFLAVVSETAATILGSVIGLCAVGFLLYGIWWLILRMLEEVYYEN